MPDTDKELLERAARAAGIVIDYSETNGGGSGNDGFDLLGNAVLDWHNYVTWNPLADDGDALRLAVKLEMVIDFRQYGHDLVNQVPGAHAHAVCHDPDDPYAATRRAIVRAAASLAMGE